MMTKTEQAPSLASLLSSLRLEEAREPSVSSSDDALGQAWDGSDVVGEAARLCQPRIDGAIV